jgi:uncharacterized protein (DUF1697 family)
MADFVAFLRGINVGGHNKVTMADLRLLLESLGFRDVKTILASGNVLFTQEDRAAGSLQQQIESSLRERYGRGINVLLRSREEIARLVAADPFAGVPVTPQTRLYVTFLPAGLAHIPAAADVSTAPDFQILSVTPREVVSVLTVTPERATPESMQILEKVFGKQVTTRNWNTILKIHTGWEARANG